MSRKEKSPASRRWMTSRVSGSSCCMARYQGQPALPLLRLLRWIVGGGLTGQVLLLQGSVPLPPLQLLVPQPLGDGAQPYLRRAVPAGRSPAVGGPGRRSPGTAPPPGQRPGTGRRDSGTPAGRAVRTGLHPGGPWRSPPSVSFCLLVPGTGHSLQDLSGKFWDAPRLLMGDGLLDIREGAGVRRPPPSAMCRRRSPGPDGEIRRLCHPGREGRPSPPCGG